MPCRLEKGAAAQIVVQGEQNADVFHPMKTGAGGSCGHYNCHPEPASDLSV